MHVFWPKTGSASRQGIALGWRVGDDALCVVSVVHGDTVTSTIDMDRVVQERTAARSKPLPPLERIAQVVDIRSSVHHGSDSVGSVDGRGMVVWVDDDGRPVSYSVPAITTYYTPPDPARLRYLALRRRVPAAALLDQSTAAALTVQDGYAPVPASPPETLDRIVELINAVKSAQAQISPPARPFATTGVAVLALALPAWNMAYTIVSFSLAPAALVVRLAVHVLSARPRVPGTTSRLPSARGLSAFVDQACRRAEQVLDVPHRFKRTLQSQSQNLQERSEQYIMFWNTVWLIANDVIIGYGAWAIVTHHAGTLSGLLPVLFETYLVTTVIDTLKWLNDWPVGLKLNTPLSQFFCSTLGTVIAATRDIVLPRLGAASPRIVLAIATVSTAGLTFPLALASDLVSLLTAHLRLCYVVTSQLNQWQLRSLSGLWNLFRGKRWNVLRQRTDSYEYEIDQLFLGALLFTVSAFLYPTILTYAALFTLIRVFVVAVERTLLIAVTALNAFPLFELLLLVKEPSRLPAGVIFKSHPPRNVAQTRPGTHTVLWTLELKSTPKSLGDVFGRSIDPWRTVQGGV